MRPDVRECAAVPHGGQSRSSDIIEAEEASDAHAVEPLALGDGVLPGRARKTVHDGLRDEQPVEGWRAQCLMRVAVVSLADPEDGPLLGEEVEAGVDLVLAVRKEEPHDRGAFACV